MLKPRYTQRKITLQVWWFLLIPFFCNIHNVVAQEEVLDSIKNQIKHKETHGLQIKEKLYAHTDRNFYVAGETLYLNLFLVDAASLQPIGTSKVAYAELLDNDDIPVLQSKILLKDGTGNATIEIPETLNSGNYTFRAYTSWMKNFDKEDFFYARVSIVNSLKYGAIKSGIKEKYSIDFFPEGGDLVNGITSKVAVKVTNGSGYGTDYLGVILDQKNDTIVKFAPLKFGMGNFTFTPDKKQKYRAIITIPKEDKKIERLKLEKDLPEIKDKGYVLHLAEDDQEHLRVEVQSHNDVNIDWIYLVIYNRKGVEQAFYSRLREGEGKVAATFSIPIKKLDEGISHITLFNSRRQPLADRLYFKPFKKVLKLDLGSNKLDYQTRQAVVIDGSCADEKGIATTAHLSMSVFLLDSLQSLPDEDIQSYLCLTSELKGKIESPSYYFTSTDQETALALDNLLLTQGWSRFLNTYNTTQEGMSLQYLPELNGPVVAGKVVDTKTGLPVAGIHSYLSAYGKNFHFLHDRSNEEGKVYFQVKNIYGYHELIGQTNTQDSNYTIKIESPFSEQKLPVLSDSLVLHNQLHNTLLTRSINAAVENAYLAAKKNKKETIKRDTVSFYGTPDQRYNFDNYTRFPTMEEVMREITKAVFVGRSGGKFTLSVINKAKIELFPGDPLVLLDGVPVDINTIMHFDPKKLKKVEIIQSKFYNGSLTSFGVISFTTPEGDLAGYELPRSAVTISFNGLNEAKEFYSPQYSTEEAFKSRIPDFRNLLYWSPNIKVDSKGKFKISFFSSDLEGDYGVLVQGISREGRVGSKTIKIKVNNAVH